VDCRQYNPLHAETGGDDEGDVSGGKDDRQHTAGKQVLGRLVCTALRVTTCLENLEMSGNLTAVRDMSAILLKVREKILSGKSCLKLFIVSSIFASIQLLSHSTGTI